MLSRHASLALPPGAMSPHTGAVSSMLSSTADPTVSMPASSYGAAAMAISKTMSRSVSQSVSMGRTIDSSPVH